MSRKRLGESINLLEPVFEPEDAWTSVYLWIIKVGKYLLVIVCLIVLGVFFARFYYDSLNNDLTKQINIKTDNILSSDQKQKEDKYFRNYILLTNDIDYLSQTQQINSVQIASTLDAIPSELTLKSISFRNGQINMYLLASNFGDIEQYSSSLTSNSRFSNVKVTVTKQPGSLIDCQVSFTIGKEG